jgi:hypothetical protein
LTDQSAKTLPALQFELLILHFVYLIDITEAWIMVECEEMAVFLMFWAKFAFGMTDADMLMSDWFRFC